MSGDSSDGPSGSPGRVRSGGALPAVMLGPARGACFVMMCTGAQRLCPPSGPAELCVASFSSPGCTDLTGHRRDRCRCERTARCALCVLVPVHQQPAPRPAGDHRGLLVSGRGWMDGPGRGVKGTEGRLGGAVLGGPLGPG